MGWPKFQDNMERHHTEIHMYRLDLICMIYSSVVWKFMNTGMNLVLKKISWFF